MGTAIIVARCSTNEKKQNLESQIIHLVDKYSIDYGIVKVFKKFESGHSNFMTCDKILDYVETRGVDFIIVTEINRITRNKDYFKYFINRCNELEVSIIDDFNEFKSLNNDKTINKNVDIESLIKYMSFETKMMKNRLDAGRLRYVKNGGKLGRKKGSIMSEKGLLIKHSDIVFYLLEGTSVRETAKMVGKAPNTVQRIRKILVKNKRL